MEDHPDNHEEDLALACRLMTEIDASGESHRTLGLKAQLNAMLDPETGRVRNSFRIPHLLKRTRKVYDAWRAGSALTAVDALLQQTSSEVKEKEQWRRSVVGGFGSSPGYIGQVSFCRAGALSIQTDFIGLNGTTLVFPPCLNLQEQGDIEWLSEVRHPDGFVRTHRRQLSVAGISVNTTYLRFQHEREQTTMYQFDFSSVEEADSFERAIETVAERQEQPDIAEFIRELRERGTGPFFGAHGLRDIPNELFAVHAREWDVPVEAVREAADLEKQALFAFLCRGDVTREEANKRARSFWERTKQRVRESQ